MEIDDASTRILAGLLEARTGQQLSACRRWRIGTALSGLFRKRGITSLDQLVAKLTLSRDTSLGREVVEALLNNETYFFRDRAMFDLLATQIIPDLAKRREESRRLSIWSVGCSTGQEVLSLAMMFAEQGARWQGWTIDILGTDVSESVIEAARKGSYSQFQIQRGLGVTQMIRWFDESPLGWQAQDKLRQMVRYEVHNILDPAPYPGGFDLILCRNVLLYFDGAHRERAFDRLASALAPDGSVMLGAGETVIGQTERLTPDPDVVGFYRHAPAAGAPRRTIGRRMAGG